MVCDFLKRVFGMKDNIPERDPVVIPDIEIDHNGNPVGPCRCFIPEGNPSLKRFSNVLFS